MAISVEMLNGETQDMELGFEINDKVTFGGNTTVGTVIGAEETFKGFKIVISFDEPVAGRKQWSPRVEDVKLIERPAKTETEEQIIEEKAVEYINALTETELEFEYAAGRFQQLPTFANMPETDQLNMVGWFVRDLKESNDGYIGTEHEAVFFDTFLKSALASWMYAYSAQLSANGDKEHERWMIS